jgi:tRNA (mo5U34)-methyltransferase
MSLLDDFLSGPHTPELREWLDVIGPLAVSKLEASGHGDYPRWRDALQQLPQLPVACTQLNNDAVGCRSESALNADQHQQLERALRQLSPWRKGPFNLFGVHIDAEWRSDRKWHRVLPHLHTLSGRQVLDVGCGNGYYAMRMLGAGAASVVGLDPGLLFNLQFHAINHYCQQYQAAVLPLPGEILGEQPFEFDTVFSMGVLYHRRDPQAHLQTLYHCLRPGGQLVLETLVIDDPAATFINGERYANMRNVWYLESTSNLLDLVAACGFTDARCVDFHHTDSSEQRQTEWMTFHSLAHALDPADPTRTIEGHPSPRRVIVTAIKTDS